MANDRKEDLIGDFLEVVTVVATAVVVVAALALAALVLPTWAVWNWLAPQFGGVELTLWQVGGFYGLLGLLGLLVAFVRAICK